MQSFNERKEEYFKRLRCDIDLLNAIVEGTSKNDEGKKAIEIILNPQNERDLDFAESVFSFFEEFTSFIESVLNHEVEGVSLEENEGIKLLIKLINALKQNTESEAKEIYENISINEFANIIAETFIAFVYNSEDAIDYLASKTDFDLDDNLQMLQFQLYLDKANNLLGKKFDIHSIKLEDISEQHIEIFKLLAEEINKIKLERMKQISGSNPNKKCGMIKIYGLN